MPAPNEQRLLEHADVTSDASQNKNYYFQETFFLEYYKSDNSK